MTAATLAPGISRRERTFPLMSRADIESMIADGRKIVVVDQYVLKLDAWLPYHPGGEKAILHVVGKDATDEVHGYHSLETLRLMERYRIGKIEGYWKNFLPPIQGGVFLDHDVCDGKNMSRTGSTIGSCASATIPTSMVSSSGSSPRSVSPSPIFDEEVELDMRGNPAAGPRHRAYAKQAGPRPVSSYTSTSSINEAETVDTADEMSKQEGVDRTGVSNAVVTAFLDAKTREEISLDLDKYPALDSETQHAIVCKYRDLSDRIDAEGLYECDYTAYAWEACRYTLLFALMLVFLRLRWYALSAIFLGSFWHQLVFTAHDAGHIAITHNYQVDTCMGIFVADFLGGLSLCWWKDNHNVHHIITNSPEHDPDIEHMPFFAISHRFLQSLRSTYYGHVMVYDAAAKFFLSIQSWSYYVILCFGRFNLYRLSWMYIIQGLGPRRGPARWHRWLEAFGQVFFWTWFGYGLVYRGIDSNWNRFVFVMISHIVTMPVHLQITLSHFAMSTAELGPDESFPQRMLRTTMDVDCPLWLDFFHGGLQFQAIHHLYPRLPRHNLRRAQKLVMKFCEDVGIPYALYGFVDGNKHVIGRLADVSRQAAILAQCQRAVAEGRA